MFCIFCGKELYEGSIYCGYCGKNVSEAMSFAEKEDALKIQVKGKVKVKNKVIASEKKAENDVETYINLVKSGEFAKAESMKDDLLLKHKNDANLLYYFLLAENKCKDDAELKKIDHSLDDNSYYSKIMIFGNNQLKKKLLTVNDAIKIRLDAGKKKEQAVIDAKIEKRREENKAKNQEWWQKNQAEVSANISRLKDREVKDIITFGKKDGKPLKWVVAEKKEDRIMVFSTECLNSEYSWGGYEKIPFNTTRKDSEWVNSSVRKWLNEDFYGKCFSAQEKERILEVKHPIPKDVVIDPVGLLFTLFKKKPDFEPGEDKIFLVSGSEWISIAVYTDILKRIPEGRNFILRESEDRDGFICVKSVHIQGGKDEYYFRTENVDEPGLIYAAMWLSLT